MPVDREVDTLVTLVGNAIRISMMSNEKTKNLGDNPMVLAAGAQAAQSLMSLLLSDVKRIADSLEILAKAQLDNETFGGLGK